MAVSSDVERSFSISRRTALKFLGIGAIGAVGYSRFAKPQPAVFQEDSLSLPFHLSRPRSAVVVGGGLAGLASAYELSRRGFEVTLLERSPQLGGKVASWDIQVNGTPFRMEHGFHGFFPQYYNLKSIAQELAITDHFRSLNRYSVVYKDHYNPEVFRPSHSAFPWNIVDLAISSTNRLNWGLNLTKREHWQVFREITGFRASSSYKRLDQISVAEWVSEDFPRGLYDLYFLPFAKSSLNSPDVLSAGELMQFFHFYFFGNPEGLAFEGTRQDMGRSLVEPIAQFIQAQGGTVLTEAHVTNMAWEKGQIASLTYQQGNHVAAKPFWVARNAPMNDAIAADTDFYGAGDTVYAAKPTDREALCLTCPHQGCTVQPIASGYRCPCHGATFDAQGTVLQGPAQRDLTRYKIAQRQADRLQLVVSQANTATAKTLTADYYVLATDVPGVQALFDVAMTGAVAPQLRTQIQQLAIADPFAVCRFWFDRDFTWEHSDFTSLSGYRLTDSITLYHRIQDDYIAWAANTGGSVVELHAYCYKEAEFPTQADLLATFEQELYDIVPALRQATVLHRELVNQKNFSGYPPGSYANRPSSQTAAPNLMLAGDWVKMPFPCGLMERAISSGLLASNCILQQEGLQRRPLLSVHPEGLFSAIANGLTPNPSTEA